MSDGGVALRQSRSTITGSARSVRATGEGSVGRENRAQPSSGLTSPWRPGGGPRSWAARTGESLEEKRGTWSRLPPPTFSQKLRVSHCAGYHPSVLAPPSNFRSTTWVRVLPCQTTLGMDGGRRELKDWSHGSRNRAYPQCKGGRIQGAAAQPFVTTQKTLVRVSRNLGVNSIGGKGCRNLPELPELQSPGTFSSFDM